MKAILVEEKMVSLENMKSSEIIKANTRNFEIKIEYHSGEAAYVGYGDKEEMRKLLWSIYNRYTSED